MGNHTQPFVFASLDKVLDKEALSIIHIYNEGGESNVYHSRLCEVDGESYTQESATGASKRKSLLKELVQYSHSFSFFMCSQWGKVNKSEVHLL